jgi:hypothetical protein
MIADRRVASVTNINASMSWPTKAVSANPKLWRLHEHWLGFFARTAALVDPERNPVGAAERVSVR